MADLFDSLLKPHSLQTTLMTNKWEEVRNSWILHIQQNPADLGWCLHTHSRSERGGHSVDLVVNRCSLDRHLNTFNSSFPENLEVAVRNVHDSHPWFLGVEHPNQSYHLPTTLVRDTRGPEIPGWCGNFSISHKFMFLARKKEKKRHI